MASARVRTLTGAGIAAGVAALVWLDTVVPDHAVLFGATLLLACGAAREAAAMSARRGRRITLALLAAVVAALLATWLDARGVLHAPPGRAWRLAVPAGAAAAVGLVLGRGRPSAALHALWIGPPLAALVLWTVAYGHASLGGLIAVSKVGDVAGYFGGRAFGRRHPFPRLSPGKTLEGCGFSLLAGVGAGALCAWYGCLGPVHGAAQGALAGLCINVAAQAGDLFESGVKRRAGVKDSGALMGASGGVLDVLDSMLFTAPVAWLAAPLFA